LNPNKRRNGFELFGFDYMIDEDFRVWLIEVNTNPYIGIHNSGMKNVLPEMFASLFKIVIDPVFDSSLDTPEKQGEYELLYSRNKGINMRRPPGEGVYPIKSVDLRKPIP